jgi:bifunctional DNA-binding transcriptional regulator/antitoxin component of YhaV-PrlF toxin-antitoxin module
MSKVTTKLQLTVPKAIPDQYGIRPGDELRWIPAGETIRVVPVGRKRKSGQELSVKERLELFDQATERQRQREETVDKEAVTSSESDADRGWTRADIYIRDLSH